MIIALPEIYTRYEPQEVLEDFTEEFRKRYGVECVSALHHNKRKTNYHIHLIFAERNYLEKPIEKIATRNMFYDEKGNHVRTKKEILDENGNIRKRCKVIKKGEVYERQIFTIKEKLFKQENFLDEVKVFYTDLMNGLVKDEKEKLLVQKKEAQEKYYYYRDYQKELNTVCTNIHSVLGWSQSRPAHKREPENIS